MNDGKKRKITAWEYQYDNGEVALLYHAAGIWRGKKINTVQSKYYQNPHKAIARIREIEAKIPGKDNFTFRKRNFKAGIEYLSDRCDTASTMAHWTTALRSSLIPCHWTANCMRCPGRRCWIKPLAWGIYPIRRAARPCIPQGLRGHFGRAGQRHCPCAVLRRAPLGRAAALLPPYPAAVGAVGCPLRLPGSTG